MAIYLELTEVNSNLAGIVAPMLLGGAAAAYVASAARRRRPQGRPALPGRPGPRPGRLARARERRSRRGRGAAVVGGTVLVTTDDAAPTAVRRGRRERAGQLRRGSRGRRSAGAAGGREGPARQRTDVLSSATPSPVSFGADPTAGPAVAPAAPTPLAPTQSPSSPSTPTPTPTEQPPSPEPSQPPAADLRVTGFATAQAPGVFKVVVVVSGVTDEQADLAGVRGRGPVGGAHRRRSVRAAERGSGTLPGRPGRPRRTTSRPSRPRTAAPHWSSPCRPTAWRTREPATTPPAWSSPHEPAPHGVVKRHDRHPHDRPADDRRHVRRRRGQTRSRTHPSSPARRPASSNARPAPEARRPDRAGPRGPGHAGAHQRRRPARRRGCARHRAARPGWRRRRWPPRSCRRRWRDTGSGRSRTRAAQDAAAPLPQEHLDPGRAAPGSPSTPRASRGRLAGPARRQGRPPRGQRATRAATQRPAGRPGSRAAQAPVGAPEIDSLAG